MPEKIVILFSQIDLPDLGKNGVLIQVKACGLAVSRFDPTSLYQVLSKVNKKPQVGAGHDVAGIVIAVGEDVTTLSKGDHIVGEYVSLFVDILFILILDYNISLLDSEIMWKGKY